jgi:hypothetical protein
MNRLHYIPLTCLQRLAYQVGVSRGAYKLRNIQAPQSTRYTYDHLDKKVCSHEICVGDTKIFLRNLVLVVACNKCEGLVWWCLRFVSSSGIILLIKREREREREPAQAIN